MDELFPPTPTTPNTYEAGAVQAELAGNPGLAVKFRSWDEELRAGGAGAGLNTDDINDYVQGMIDGFVPPLLPGRASPNFTAIMAEAARRGYDLQRAALDWRATERYLQSRNATPQIRLNQAIEGLPGLLDEVEHLAQQWNAGPFPALTRAQMEIAIQGGMGEEANIIAVALEGQIADAVSDLAVVYMGGNSPTDKGLGLAEKALSGDWNEAVLMDMINRARTNVDIRRNSLNLAGVQGASLDNPYAPQNVGANFDPYDRAEGSGPGPTLTPAQQDELLRSAGVK
tara:strand:- start:234 stop:1088 length:855 start_codon:yes stop_codon:yes gene_type:complete